MILQTPVREPAPLPPPGPRRARLAALVPRLPRILFVLTGGSRQVLHNRISDLQATAAQHPLVSTMARTVPLGAAVLESLELQGPTDDVSSPLSGGGPQSWTQL